MTRTLRRALAFAVVALAAGCDARGGIAAAPDASSRAPASAPLRGTTASAVRAERVSPPSESHGHGDAGDVAVRTRWPAAERVVAVGDVHGDLGATERVLELAGVAKGGHWTGGKTILVQVGDVLDRGDGERAILDLLEQLEGEARGAGGDVIVLNGNHELMNAAGDFRYVTPGGFEAFRGADDGALPPFASRLPEAQRPRAAAFAPGGRYARRLAKHPTVAIVGETVFAHGGLEPQWANDLETLNGEVSRWLGGLDPKGARVVAADDGPVWSRRYAETPDDAACAEVDRTLSKVGARRMVIGHTVQRSGISSACGDKVWRIDVGLAAYYGGHAEALELTRDGARPLKE